MNKNNGFKEIVVLLIMALLVFLIANLVLST